MGATKAMYPQDTVDNEYRYLDFCWLDEMAMGLVQLTHKPVKFYIAERP